jgi:hypothetical protein
VTNVGVSEREKGPEMSEAQISFTLGNEVETMTTTISVKHFHDAPSADLARPTGMTRLVLRMSTAMLIWAANRANRAVRSPDEHRRILAEARARQGRQHDALLMQARLR